MHPISSDIMLRDSKGRNILAGTHRDILASTRLNKVAIRFGAAGAEATSDQAKATMSSEQEHVPMTGFQWEIPAVMVTSIPGDIESRNDKYKYVASQLKIKSA